MCYSKFYPKKVIQIVGVKLSTEISQVKKVIQKSYPKTFIQIQPYLTVQR